MISHDGVVQWLCFTFMFLHFRVVLRWRVVRGSLAQVWLNWSRVWWTFYICGYVCCNIGTVMMSRHIETMTHTNKFMSDDIFYEWTLTHSFIVWFRHLVEGGCQCSFSFSRSSSFIFSWGFNVFSKSELLPNNVQCSKQYGGVAFCTQQASRVRYCFCFVDLGNFDAIQYIETRLHLHFRIKLLLECQFHINI